MKYLLACFSVLAIAACKFDPPAAVNGDAGIDAPDGLPVISFAQATTSADEDIATVMVEVKLSEAVGTTVSATLGVTGGNATSPDDFILPADTVAFSPGETSKQYPITIVKDLLDNEPLETVEIGISAPMGATVDAAKATHTISISNIALPRVNFVAATTSTNEQTQTSVQVTLDKPAQGDSTVVLNVTGATPVSDYAIADGTVVTILDGQMAASVAIGEVDDALDELDENVTFSFGVTSTNLVLGTQTTSTHTILDNDAQPTVQFTVATSSAAENLAGGSVTIEVSLDAPSGRDITVDFSRDAGSSASDPGDATVTGAPGTLTFLAGETTHTIAVAIVDDAADENNEDVVVELGNATNATLGGRDTHTLTITDDDAPPDLSFELASSSASEAAGTVDIKVKLSAASGRNLNVVYTVGGNAQGADFDDLTISPVAIAAGATEAIIQIQINQDTTDENPETVVLTLGNTANATEIAPTVHTLTITDDDTRTVQFDPAIPSRSQNEGDFGTDQFTFDLILDAASSRTITVPIILSGDAIIPNDYTISGIPVTFSPGQTRRTITYNVVGDNFNENGPDDTIIMSIDTANVTNALVGNDDERQHVIIDDD